MRDHGIAADEAVTLEEFERLPPGEGRTELVRGRVVREPPPAPLHGRIQARLLGRIEPFVSRRGLGVVVGEAAFLLSREPPIVRAPDLAFIASARVPANAYALARWEMAPDLAVEVVSPSNLASDVQEKVLDWMDAGAREVWVVDPAAETVTAHSPAGHARVLRGGDALRSDLLPGFVLPLPELFSA